MTITLDFDPYDQPPGVVTPLVHTAGMCDICDGVTHQQSMERIHENVVSGSWAIQGVEGDAHQRSWAYTIGLTENFGHPELVIVDAELPDSGHILNVIGDLIDAGDHLAAGDTFVDADGSIFELVAVHPSYLPHGLCAVWAAYYGWGRIAPAPLDVLQVIRPPSCYCEHHGADRLDLSVPGGAMTVAGPNRAARRRAARGR